MGKSRRKWWPVCAWFAAIVVTAPVMPIAISAIRDSASDVGPDWVSLSATAGIALAGCLIGLRLVRALEELPRGALAWCAAILAAYVALLLHTPVAAEKFHILEYGLLAYLVLVAVRRGRTDGVAFVTALAVTYLLGLVDETLQYYSPWYDWWELPRRNGEIHDALTNLWAVFLALVLATRLETARDCRRPRRRHYARATVATAVAWLGSGLFMYEFSEYGHRYEDPAVGAFFSRLDPEALERRDRVDGDRIGRLLAEHRDTAYGNFVIDLYPAARDPFVHEVRVHIFRRDRYMRNRNAAIVDEGRLNEAHSFGVVAQREDEILRRYFGRTLVASGYGLSDEERSWLDESDAHLRHPHYESAVSNRIITAFDRRTVAVISVLGLVLIAALGHVAASRSGAR